MQTQPTNDERRPRMNSRYRLPSFVVFALSSIIRHLLSVLCALCAFVVNILRRRLRRLRREDGNDHGEVVKDAAGKDEDVPDGVKIPDLGIEGEEEDACRVGQASGA